MADSDTLMHVIESMGVLHTEVGCVEQFTDLIRIYPCEPERLLNPHFVLDQHLGRVAAYLRMLGIDVLHSVPAPDEELAATLARDDRVLLTRDVGLLIRREVRRGYFVRATDPLAQLAEVVKRVGLLDGIAPSTRCFRSNAPLVPVGKAVIRDRLPPRTAELFDDFRQCPTCERVYWKGSHYERMQSLLERVRNNL